MKSYKPDQVMNGTFGEAWIDSDFMSETTSLEAKFKLTKSDVPQTGTLSKGQKVTAVEGSGTIKFNKVTSYMVNLLLEKIKQGKTPVVTIISNLNDPAAIGNERVKLTGVTFDEVTLIDWEAGKLGEESYPFTFTGAEPLDTAQ